jgi:NTE family protein
MIPETRQILVINILFFILFTICPVSGGAQGKAHRPKVALVLSGGGAKGFAHIGVLKVLEEEGIPIDIIVGTSMGSLVGGIYAIGYSSAELDSMVKHMDWNYALSDDVPRKYLSRNDQFLKQRYIFSLPVTDDKKLSLPQGFIKGQNILNFFCGVAGNVPVDQDFSNLPIKYACVATDLQTGEEVVLNKGFLPTALFSSMAIPLAFQPANRDGRLLVDGGLVDNFPTDVARRMGADIIIGVDIRRDIRETRSLRSINTILSQLIGFFDQSKDSVNKSLCDLIIKPDVNGYSVSSFNSQAADTLIRRGQEAADKLRPELRELKQKYNLHPSPVSRALVKPESWHITRLTFTGNAHLEQEFLRKTVQLPVPGDYSAERIKSAIDRLYGLGGFDRIYYQLIDNGQGKTLNLSITTQEIITNNIGFKANTTDAAAILINTTRKNYKNVFGLLSASAEFSVNPGLSFLIESNRTNVPILGISLNGKYQNFSVFEGRKKDYKANVFFSSASLYVYQSFLNNFYFGVGLQEEYYHGDIFSKSNTTPIISNKIDEFLTSAYSYLTFDNWDDYYFPTKGTNFDAEFSMMTKLRNVGKLSPALLLKIRNVWPVSNRTAVLFDVYSRGLLNSDYPLTKATFVGGEPYSQYFNYHLPFVGLPAVYLADRFVNVGLLGARCRFAESQYLSLLFNVMMQSNQTAGLENINLTYGGGIKYALKSLLGPLDVTLGYSTVYNKPTFSANFGFWF